jgi:epoxyqueuosine reductase QueG
MISPEAVRALVITIVHDEEIKTALSFWRDPLVSAFPVCSDTGSPLNFTKSGSWLKEAVSSTHLLPGDVLPGAKSIIAFFIPFTERVAEGNREGESASAEWALCYIRTNELIAKINNGLETLFAREGLKTGKIPATHNFDEERLVSDWSHRHIAYLAGLGTFGLNNMLITQKGCCGRFGSIVTEWPYYAPPGTGQQLSKTGAVPEEKCLFKRNGSCRLCIKRCPAGAYTLKAGDSRENPNILQFDRKRCYSLCLKNAEKHKNLGYADVCGKCLTGLPCSVKAP